MSHFRFLALTFKCNCHTIVLVYIENKVKLKSNCVNCASITFNIDHTYWILDYFSMWTTDKVCKFYSSCHWNNHKWTWFEDHIFQPNIILLCLGCIKSISVRAITAHNLLVGWNNLSASRTTEKREKEKIVLGSLLTNITACNIKLFHDQSEAYCQRLQKCRSVSLHNIL